MNAYTLRWAAVLAVFALLYGSRLSRGAAQKTAEGTEYPLKPMVIASYLGALLLYAGFLGYSAYASPRGVPWWFYLVFLLAMGLILLRLPGTITVGSLAVRQRYWFLKERVIGYSDVVAVQVYSAGRAVRVTGNAGVAITHTNNHVAQPEFLAEMGRATGGAFPQASTGSARRS